MPTTPLWKGKDSKLLFTFLDAKLPIDNVDWEVAAVGEEIEDDICGEDRSRLDYVLSHHTLVINAMQQKVDLIKAFIKQQKQRDARSLPGNSAVGILIYMNDSTVAAYQCREYILGNWKFGAGGRKERNKASLPGRFRYFDELQTIG
jgi:hypothetical protein